MTRRELTQLADELGLDAVGVARAEPYVETERHIRERRARGLFGGMRFTMAIPEVSCHPEALLPGARSVVSAALCYYAPGPEPGAGEGKLPRYAWRDHYALLRDRLDALGRCLGGEYRVLVDENQHVDREAAVRSGVGFYGKNTMVITRRHGSWVVLGALVTDRELEPTEPLDASCGECRLCIDACPTGALEVPGELDATRCLSYWTQAPGAIPEPYREELGGSVYGCDICQDVCPWNRGVEKRRARDPLPDGAEPVVSLVDWLDADGDELVERYDRLFVHRNDSRWLRRNALVALGSTGEAEHAEALEPWLDDPDEVVRETASWARERVVERSRRRADRAPSRPPATSSHVEDRLAVLVHELRSPVAALVAIEEALSSRGPRPGTAERHRLLELAVAAGRTIERLLADADAASVRAERLELARLVHDVAGGRATVDAEPDLVVSADPVRLRQALDNLLDNALRHGSTVVVTALAEGGEAHVTVGDDGPGVQPGLDVFASGVSGSGSTGYGLAIARAIAEAHGGRVELVPTDAGACFRLALPLAAGG